MKIALALIATAGLTSIALAQSTTPAAAASASSSASAHTDTYRVRLIKSAMGKAAEDGDSLKKQAPDVPMPGHYIVLRHEDGDNWDYCVIEHLGNKGTADAARLSPSPAATPVNDWGTDTIGTGPSWAQFAKEMGIDDPSKTRGSAYVVSVYRPAPGMRDDLDKFLNQAPDRASDSTSGNVVLEHQEGTAFLKISRNNNWSDFAKDQTASIAQMNKTDTGWFKLRNLISFHTDTLCDRMAP